MIPDEAVEAAARAVARFVTADADAMHNDYDESVARAALEAAAPHLMAANAERWESAEEQVKEIVQDVAMTVDYAERLHNAVQKIMRATLGRKPDDA